MKRSWIYSLATMAAAVFACNASAAPKKVSTKPGKSEAMALAITGGNKNAKKGGTLVFEDYEPTSLNPINYKEAGAINVLQKWVFESLLDMDVVSGEHIPMLAKSWDISEDGKEYTFTIDERATWFDGKPVTAEDVKFSFDVHLMSAANSPFRKSKVDDFSKIEVIKPNVIKFTAKERVFSAFEFLASTLILPQHIYFANDVKKLEKNEFFKTPKGSGPYIVEKWEKGVQCILKRNPKYWANVLPQNVGAYNFDALTVKYVRDAQIAFEMLKKGELDSMPIRVGNTQLWRQTKTSEQFVSGKIKPLEVINKIQNGYGFIGFNLQNPLFKEKRVRKALAMAVNCNEIITKSLDNLAVIPHGPLYSLSSFEGKFQPVKFDTKAATAELAALGWKDTDGDYILDKNGQKFSFSVLVPNARIEKELLFVQDYWKKIGVDAKIKILEYNNWLTLQSDRKFEALANGRSRPSYEQNVDPYGEWHSENAKPGLGNYYTYENKEVDKLIADGRQEINFRKRKAIFTKVNDIIAEDYVIFQYSESKATFFTVNSKVVLPSFKGQNWYPYSLGDKYWSFK